ncbi:MAG: ankyrin repeat domain-containing protein [Dokdonella sp.]|uniref:ankyrin repeat domain-containing protein n=1 Tax=Dokdonella sp. TaxID=2291710 RepID=UPI003262F500
MTHDDFGNRIRSGDLDGVRRALLSDESLASRPIRWFLNQQNESDPLHYIADCVGQGWLTNGTEGELARLMIEHGASINGSGDRETPLIGAASMGVERVASVLIEAGADLERTSVFGARALHWAAWMGNAATVGLMVSRGAALEARCSQYGATPLFWAVHGFGPGGPCPKGDQVGAARILLDAGARVQTTNSHGQSAIELSGLCGSDAMYELLLRSA